MVYESRASWVGVDGKVIQELRWWLMIDKLMTPKDPESLRRHLNPAPAMAGLRPERVILDRIVPLVWEQH
jgi:hypothetical protein